MAELSLGGGGRGRGRGSLLKDEKPKTPRGRGEVSSHTGSGESTKPSLSTPHHSELSPRPASSGGDFISALGRGATRGVRERPPSQLVLFTRPPELNKKQGAGGSPVDLLTNYFSLVQKPNWSLYQYAVTFKPDLEDARVS